MSPCCVPCVCTLARTIREREGSPSLSLSLRQAKGENLSFFTSLKSQFSPGLRPLAPPQVNTGRWLSHRSILSLISPPLLSLSHPRDNSYSRCPPLLSSLSCSFFLLVLPLPSPSTSPDMPDNNNIIIVDVRCKRNKATSSTCRQ